MPFLIGNEFHFYLEKTRQSCQQNYAYNFIKYSGLPAKDRHLPRGAPAFFPRRTSFSPFHGRMVSTRKAGGRDIVGGGGLQDGRQGGAGRPLPAGAAAGMAGRLSGRCLMRLLPGSGFTGGREPFSGEGRAAAGRYPPAGRRPSAGPQPPGMRCFARCCLPLRARSYCGRSSTRREMASATWAGAMASLPSRSAMVRARRSTRV